jgi:uncharacterized membrane protein SirB2
MTYEFMVLFGGSVVLLSLRRTSTKQPKTRPRGFIRVIAVLIEGLVVVTGVTFLTIGLVQLIR